MHLPGGLAVPPAEQRRRRDEMRAAVIEMPAAAAAARLLHVAAGDLLQDGTYLYRRHAPEPGPGAPRGTGHLRQGCCDVVRAGERTLAAGGPDAAPHSALSELMGELRRMTLLALVHAVPEGDRPRAEALVHRTAALLAEIHPAGRERRAMAVLAGRFEDRPFADDAAAMAMLGA